MGKITAFFAQWYVDNRPEISLMLRRIGRAIIRLIIKQRVAPGFKRGDEVVILKTDDAPQEALGVVALVVETRTAAEGDVKINVLAGDKAYDISPTQIVRILR